MKALRRNEGDYTVYELRGELDQFSSPPLLEQLKQELAAGCMGIVLNMRRVRFISSRGLTTILKARKLLRAAHAELAVSQPSVHVREAVELVGLQRVVPFHSDDEAALAHVMQGVRVLA